MAVSPVRALLTARLVGSWNQARRSMRIQHALVAGLLLGVGWCGAVAGGGLTALLGGWALGARLVTAPTPEVVAVLSWVLFGAVFVAGTLFAVLGGGQVLDVAQLRQFPLRPRVLLATEVIGRLGDPTSVAMVAVLTCLCLGLLLPQPSLGPWLLLVWGWCVLTYLALQVLVLQASAWLMARLRVAVALAGLVGLVALGVSSSLARRGPLGPSLEGLWPELPRFAALLPTTPVAQWLAAVAVGDPGRAWEWLTLSFVAPALLLWAAGRLLSREAQEGVRAARRGPERLWSFSSPTLGIARLQVTVVLGSHWGRFAMLLPFFAVALLPLAGSSAPALLPAGMATYAATGLLQVQVNQFGLDGAAVGSLFCLPVTSRELLLGKRLGLLALSAAQGLFVVLASWVLLGADAPSCLAAALLFLCHGTAQNLVGQSLSVRWPRVIARRSLKQDAAPLPATLWSLLYLTLSGAGFLGLYWALAERGAAPLVLGLLAFLGLLETAWWMRLPAASALLEARREQVLLALH